MEVSPLFAYADWCQRVLRRHLSANLQSLEPRPALPDQLAVTATLDKVRGDLPGVGRSRQGAVADQIVINSIWATLAARGAPHDERVRIASQQVSQAPEHVRKTASRVSALLSTGRRPTRREDRDRLLGLAAFLPLTFVFEHESVPAASVAEANDFLMAWSMGTSFQCKALVMTNNQPERLVALRSA